MTHVRDISTAVALPSPPQKWFDYAYAVLSDDRLGILRLRVDAHAENLRWWEERKVTSGLSRPDLWGDRIQLSVFDGEAETGVIEVPACPYPLPARLADGRWLVASDSCADGQENGHLFMPDGSPSGTILLGDGIAHIRCAPDNTIWIGYFDEGVFAGYSGEEPPISTGGLVRFSSAGNVLWSFNKDAPGRSHIDGCYALTLAGNVAWTCYYSGFPITAIEGAQVRTWVTDISGASALAVDTDRALLVGGYGKRAGWITLVKLFDEAALQRGRLSWTAPAPGRASLVQGHGATLHMVADGIWLKLTVAEVEAHVADWRVRWGGNVTGTAAS